MRMFSNMMCSLDISLKGWTPKELEAVGRRLEELRLDDLVARLEAGAGAAGG